MATRNQILLQNPYCRSPPRLERSRCPCLRLQLQEFCVGMWLLWRNLYEERRWLNLKNHLCERDLYFGAGVVGKVNEFALLEFGFKTRTSRYNFLASAHRPTKAPKAVNLSGPSAPTAAAGDKGLGCSADLPARRQPRCC